jgi:predicted sulfurtransferase
MGTIRTMGKILLFYKYIDIKDPHKVMAEQRKLCESLGLKGRILLAGEGINGTLGGTTSSVELYKDYMNQHALFSAIDFKEGQGAADYFPRLQIKVKKEIVHLGLNPEEITAHNAGTYITPQEAHALLAKKPENLVLLDTRNDYESRVGTFEGALIPNTKTFREFPAYIESNLEKFKDKQVLMFCTGGIRCERASAYLKLKKVAKEVYHIKGGIHRYVEQFPNGFFKGKNYVFDGRVTTHVTNDVLTECDHCKAPYDEYTNCINAECNRQIIVCPSCTHLYHNTCSSECKELVAQRKVKVRTIPHKISAESTGDACSQ